jgi:hypothetical protein
LTGWLAKSETPPVRGGLGSMKRAGGVLLALAAAIATWAGTSGAAPHPDCRPPGALTQAFSGELKVYTLRGQRGHRAALYVCRRPRGHRKYLLGGQEEKWFGPHAIDLARYVLAVGVSLDDPTEASATRVPVYDFAKRGGPLMRSVFVGLDLSIGSVAVDEAYDVAYIVRVGKRHDVFVVPAGHDEEGDGTLVDSGRSIDALSLRREGDRVTWLKDGKRRSASLSAP